MKLTAMGRCPVTLNCPGQAGYETAVTVLKINEALHAGCKIKLTPGDFAV